MDVTERAKLSAGASTEAVYLLVDRLLSGRHPGGGTLLDVGCGRGDLWPAVGHRFDRYVGADVMRFDGFPAAGDFTRVDLDSGRVDRPDGSADVVVAAETIEHVENPRALMRELARLCRPGGWVVVTTPNNLSLLSKLTLVAKNQFNAFQDGSYPAHITAVVEQDLRRMAAECGLSEVAVGYSRRGRMPGVGWHYPAAVGRLLPRSCSDNVGIIGTTPERQ
jgi:2-polyprenyl-3-methyl-5-hydroxy-6-metoxy-1,4-benzoquinol methylase